MNIIYETQLIRINSKMMLTNMITLVSQDNSFFWIIMVALIVMIMWKDGGSNNGDGYSMDD